MGLIIKPKSKLRALQSRILSWESLKMVYRGEPIIIAWDKISRIFILHKGQNPNYLICFETADGFQTSLYFFIDETSNTADFESFLINNPEKLHSNRMSYFREHVTEYFVPYFRYGAITTKWMIGLLALTFMFFQMKYFGSLLIQKYQFLIKASCNQQCANELWSMSTLWFYVMMTILAPLIPILFYKKIYKSAAKSKDIQLINGTMAETFSLAGVGLFMLFCASPKIWTSTAKYTKVLAAYSDGSLQAKLSQKVEMASKRKFQGDVDDTEEIEILEDQHEE